MWSGRVGLYGRPPPPKGCRTLFEGESPLLRISRKLVVIGILLCLALGATIFLAAQTVQAIQHFREQHALRLAGDVSVSTIRPWMTIPYISRAYNVPESYLYESLNITDPKSVRRTSLHSLAARYNRPVDRLIRDIQTAIETYRKQHPPGHSFPSWIANELLAQERGKT